MIKDGEKKPCAFLADVSCSVHYKTFSLKIDDVTVTRGQDGRGHRWRCGHLLGKHHIVRLLTRFLDVRREPPSKEVIGLMEGAVSLIEQVLDSLNDSIDDEVRRRILMQVSRSRGTPYVNQHGDIDFYPDEEKQSEAESYLYLFRHDNGLTKIGFSKNPEKREKTIQAEDPRVHMLATRKGKLSQEARLHKIFAEKRVRGEWFDLNENDIDWLFFVCGFQKHEEFNLQSQ